MPRFLNNSACVSAVIAFGATATLCAALFYEHVLGYAPCALCLVQRWPYYLGIPVAVAAVALLQNRQYGRRLAVPVLALLAVIFAVSAGLGIHHSGVEWGWWAGPAACSPAAGAGGSVADLFSGNAPRLISCTAASWRFLGLSFAGWNAVISSGLTFIALYGARRPRQQHDGHQPHGHD